MLTLFCSERAFAITIGFDIFISLISLLRFHFIFTFHYQTASFDLIFLHIDFII